MGNSSSSEEQQVPSKLPDLGDNVLSWKKHSAYVTLVEKIREKSPAVRKLNDSQIGALFLCRQAADEACSDAVFDRRKFAETCLTIAQAESSSRNLPHENHATAVGIYQQTKTFGQRDIKGHWKETLSKETRLHIKESTGRIYRIMNNEQKDWRDKDIVDVCYRIQVCEKENKGIYSDKDRIEVSRTIAGAFYPDQPSMKSRTYPEPTR
ncbi:hypothetical protein BU24DRAFT_476255 [Aaosphaeria arxii CBS 175.79]|uniref:Uncharacterized protein n=1 Tax=Aaosphaeria arxii CBS 175.79 TaxID=1450172 RepID=A0A6A5Y332_9PLEO|nr:uncharacterized protein BU24DRAFT_476255 [Aaosphaeria arxii CBS 175.79]KAF2019210.1 hypothetical protein BU24DRAFT_476255 [Aaosphaeria arxii CBS 175.79]